MERQSPPKILQLKSSMYHANFCTKYETKGPPRSTRDYPFLSMDNGYHAYEYVTTFVFSSGTRPDQSARGLAALSYI